MEHNTEELIYRVAACPNSDGLADAVNRMLRTDPELKGAILISSSITAANPSKKRPDTSRPVEQGMMIVQAMWFIRGRKE